MTNLRFTGILFIAIFVFIGINEVNAQSRKRLRELEKTEQSRADEERAATEAAKKRHMDIQSKQTRKEMKQYRKKNKRLNNNRREPFYKKWFRKG